MQDLDSIWSLATKTSGTHLTLKILALETSTEYCSLALWLDGEIHCKETLANQQHSQLLLPMVQEILAETETSLAQLNGIAFGAGPGSFTGLRIACGVAQGLAFANNLPVAGISTLQALAHNNKHNKIIVALDARMHEIYCAAYIRTANHWQTIIEPTVCPPDQAPLLPGDDWVGCGNGFAIYQKQLSKHYSEQISCINNNNQYPHAKEIAQLSLEIFSTESGVNAANAAPIYIRNKVALKESER